MLNIINFGCATWISIPPDYGPGILHGVKRMRRSRFVTEIPIYGGHRSFTSQFICQVTCIVTCFVVSISRILEKSRSLSSKDLSVTQELQDSAPQIGALKADKCVPVLDTCCSVQDIRGFWLESSRLPEEIADSGPVTLSSLASLSRKLVWNILWF